MSCNSLNRSFARGSCLPPVFLLFRPVKLEANDYEQISRDDFSRCLRIFYILAAACTQESFENLHAIASCRFHIRSHLRWLDARGKNLHASCRFQLRFHLRRLNVRGFLHEPPSWTHPRIYIHVVQISISRDDFHMYNLLCLLTSNILAALLSQKPARKLPLPYPFPPTPT